MAGEDSVYTAGNGALWVQPKGPGTDLVFLGCHDVPSLEEPLGDYTALFCPDPSKPKEFIEVGETHAPPAAVTMQIVEDVTNALSYLREQACPFPIYINMVECGRKDVFGNAAKTLIVDARKITNRSTSNLASREGDERMERTYDIAAAPPVIEVRSVSPIVLTESEATALLDISFCGGEQCAGNCGSYEENCENGIASGSGGTAASANVLYTGDAGVAWSTAAADPFAATEDPESLVCFKINQTTTRWLAVRDSDGATNAEIAYSDDSGATWTNVDIENGGGFEGALGPNAVFALDGYNIWIALSSGYIVKSSDQGLTWTTQTAGGVTAQDLYAVHFSDTNNGVAGGASGVVLITSDGGKTWTAASAISGTPTVQAVWSESKNVFFVGTVNGYIYKSEDGGVTYTAMYTGTNIKSLKFANKFVAYAIDDTYVRRTRNGWTDYETITPPASPTAVNSLYVCGPNLAFVAGEDSGNAGYIVKISG
jgi:hypothetical protein